MNKLFAPLLAAALLLLPAFAGAEADLEGITVHGTGRVAATPDEASVTLGVLARSAELTAARDDVSSRSAAVLAQLRALGIEARDINAAALTLRPEYRWDKATETQVLRGYKVKRRIEVRLRDLSRLGELLEGAADAGANEVSPPALGHSREQALRREALQAAAQDARANAAAIAGSLDVALGELRSLVVRSGSAPLPVAREQAMLSASADQAAASYTTGDLYFESRVNATFALSEAAGSAQ